MKKPINSNSIIFKAVTAANFNNFDLEIKKQSINCIVGPNASGKTLLAHHLVYKSSLKQILPLLGEIKISLPFSNLDVKYEEASGIIPAVDILCLANTLNPKKTIAEFLGVDKILAELALSAEQPKCSKADDCGLKLAQAQIVAREILENKNIQRILITVLLEKNKNLEVTVSKLIKLGFSRFLLGKEIIKVQEVGDEVTLFLKMEKKKELYAVLSSVDCNEKSEKELRQILNESLETAYGIGQELLVIFSDLWQKIYCKNAFYCSSCQKTLAFSELRGLSNIKNMNGSDFDLYLGKHSLNELSKMKIAELAKLSYNNLSKYLELLIKFGFKENLLSQSLATLNVAEKIKLLCIYYQLAQFSDILFVLDSPSRFLNILEQKQLLLWAKDLVRMGNCVLFAEISSVFSEAADNLITLEPLSDEETSIVIKKIPRNEGNLELLLKAFPNKLLKLEATNLRESNEIVKELKASFQVLKKTRKLKVIAPNLRYLKVLDYYIEEELFDKKISDQTVLEFSCLISPLAKLYASLSQAKKEGLNEKDFLRVEGRVKCCEIKWNNLNINDVFKLEVSAARELFASRDEIVELFDELILLGFSKLSLSRKYLELSFSEAQLLRLFREFSSAANLKNTAFVIEQVCAGLDNDCNKRCLKYLQRKTLQTANVFLVEM